MKFRATISERGIQMLHRFIPTLERFGKRADLFLSEEDLSLIMQEKDTQGAQLVVMIQAGVLWVPGSLVLESRHQNLIATEVDLEQLGKVFQGAIKHAAEQVQVKLSLLEIKASPAGPAAKKPSLSFQLPGEQLRLTQELPVGKPHPSSRINELVACKNHFHPLSWYLDIGAQVSDLQPIVEQLKRVSPTVTLGIAKSGSLYLEVDSGGLFLGSEISHLPVCPDQGAGQRFTPTATSAHTRLAEAVEAGYGARVVVITSLFLRILRAKQLTEPAKVLLGIPEDGGCLHVVFVYSDPAKGDAIDECISLSCLLPVQET